MSESSFGQGKTQRAGGQHTNADQRAEPVQARLE
jgi:hypothetical protein